MQYKAILKAFPKRGRKQVSIPAGSSETESVTVLNTGGQVLVSFDLPGYQSIQIWLNPTDLLEAAELAIRQRKELLPKMKIKELAFDEKISKNLIGGGLFVEKVGTPGYLSPSSESYWSA